MTQKRKIVKKFAFFPRYFNNKVIWFKKYTEVKELRTYTGLLSGTGKEVEFEGWVVIDII